MVTSFLLAVVFILCGHLLKTYRWKQFIEVYEKPRTRDLLYSLTIQHTLNIMSPIRIGDMVRIAIIGRKLKNSYPFAIATVLVDLYLDVMTVGLFFISMQVIDIKIAELDTIFKIYVLMCIILILFTLFCSIFKKQLKRIIQKISSIFNSKIELNILYTSYIAIASFRDIYKHLNKVKLLIVTIGIWFFYIISYAFFSRTVTYSGDMRNTWEIFTLIFSQNCFQLIKESSLNVFSIFMAVYMLSPLLLIGLYLFLTRNINKVTQEIAVNKYILPQLNENDKLSFLKTYFSKNDSSKLHLYLDINSDVNVIRDYSAGSNATTLLCINENTTFYRKYALGEESIKLKEQINWIESHKGQLKVTPILRTNYQKDFVYYDMPYKTNAVSFFQYIHTSPIENCWDILHSVVLDLNNQLYQLQSVSYNIAAIEKYYDEKVLKNIETIMNGGKFINKLMSYETIDINGELYPNLSFYINMLSKENLISIFENDVVGDIHGDLTIENIICVIEEPLDYYIIDPNIGNIHSSKFLDYGKLLQSLHGGYEFLMLVKHVSIERNEIRYLNTRSTAYDEMYKRFNGLLHELFTEKEVKSIYFHEIIHWLRLMPYKIQKDDKKAVVFYSELLIILHKIYNMYEV